MKRDYPRYHDGTHAVPSYLEACRIYELAGHSDVMWNVRARRLILEVGLKLIPFAPPFLVSHDLPMIAPPPLPGGDNPWPQSLMVWQADQTEYSAAQSDTELWVWQVWSHSRSAR